MAKREILIWLYIPKTFEFQDYIENKDIDKKNTLQKLFIGMLTKTS